jgi:ferritin-like metal-binding protein YciE
MPPQQLNGLLDLFDQVLGFRTHRVVLRLKIVPHVAFLKSSRNPRLPREEPARSRNHGDEHELLFKEPSSRRTVNQCEGIMGLFSSDIKTLNDLFVHQLRDIYYAEKQIVQALPDMIEKATDAGLKQGFEAHLGETKNHVKRVEQVFKMHGVDAKGVDCPAIDGIIEEADEVIGDVDDKSVLDAALIAAAQAVEHYEMTRYGTLVAWAKQLGRPDCASVLQQNLDEEKAADAKLTSLAERNVNVKAA